MRGQSSRLLTRPFPNRLRPSTDRARTSGPTDPAGSRPKVRREASTAALTSSTEPNCTASPGSTASASHRPRGSSLTTTTLSKLSPRPSMALRISSRAISRCGVQNRSTGTYATPPKATGSWVVVGAACPATAPTRVTIISNATIKARRNGVRVAWGRCTWLGFTPCGPFVRSWSPSLSSHVQATRRLAPLVAGKCNGQRHIS